MADNVRNKQAIKPPHVDDCILEDPALSPEEIKQAFQIVHRYAVSTTVTAPGPLSLMHFLYHHCSKQAQADTAAQNCHERKLQKDRLQS